MAQHRMDSFLTVVQSDYRARSEQLMLEDIEKSGLDEHMAFCVVQNEPPVMPCRDWVRGSYRFWYFDREGNMIEGMYRDRLFFYQRYTEGQLKEQGLGKYRGPSRAAAAAVGVDAAMPYLYPHYKPGKIGIICEGEKKTAAAADRFKCPVIGIGGCWMWADGTLERGLHPDIVWWIEKNQLETVLIIPDTDIGDNRGVQQAYGGLLLRVQTYVQDSRIVPLPDKLDEYLVSNKHFTFKQLLGIEGLSLADLEISAGDLIREYGLLAIEVGPANARRLKIVENEENVYRVLTHAPAYAGLLRFNEDSWKEEFEGKEFQQNVTETKIQCNFQAKFHMPLITPNKVVRPVYRVCRENSYSPFKTYLEGLPRAKGKSTMDELFAGSCRTDSDELHRTAAFIFLGGIVKRALHPGCPFRGMVIAGGPQKIGKTELATWAVGRKNVTDIRPDSMAGDEYTRRIAEARILRVDDVESFTESGRNMGRLKSQLSATTDSIRKPWDKSYETVPRKCIWYGTTNKSLVLPYDETGNTRMLYVPVRNRWDFEWLRVNRDRCFAEAYWRIMDGDDPTELDISAFAKEQEGHIEDNQWVDEIEMMTARLLNNKAAALVLWRDKKYFAYRLMELWSMAMGTGGSRPPTMWEQRRFSEGLIAKGWLRVDNRAGPMINGERPKRIYLFAPPVAPPQ